MPALTDLVRLSLLGGFSLHVGDGDEVTIASKKARGLLAYLALARGKSASREQIAAIFWPDSGEKEARQSLRQALSALRKALGDAGDVLSADSGQVGLLGDRIEVDVDRVLEALASDDPARALAASKAATGPLLPNHTFGADATDDWLCDERVRVRDASRRLLLRCVDEPSLDDEARIEIYWQILAFEPACEEAHRGLMRAYARTDRRSQALAQFQACEDALARHLDAAPSHETVQLFQELRASDATVPDEPARAATLPLPAKPSIAVLAFANLSGDERQDYLCDGISEDITTFLSQFSSLYVMSRTTALAFKGKAVPIPEIGRQLGVHYVLEGSVRLAGDRIRVTAQLTEAEHGGQVWANRYDGTLDDVFAFQDDIAQRIVATAAGRIEAEALSRAQRKAARDLDAYDYLLRGKYHHHRCTARDSEAAVDLFKKALEKDPDWPLARGWLACAIGRAARFGQTRTRWMNSSSYKELLDGAMPLVDEALEVDAEESECLRLLGEVHLFRRDYEMAERFFRRAHQFNPNDDRILSQMAAFLTYTDQPEEAVRFAQLAIRLNPYHPGFYRFNLGRALMCLGRYEEAAETIASATPQQAHWRPYLAACYAALGRDREAARVVREIFDAEPDFSLEYLSATMLFRSRERTDELFRLMEAAGLPRKPRAS